MPVTLISELVPKNNGLFALLDDEYLRGGFHIVANLTERNQIPVDRRKHGMLVFVQTTDIAYRLQADLVSWEVDKSITTTLQDCYNAGNEIQIIDGKPFIIKNNNEEILKITADQTLEFNHTLKGKHYTSSINASVGSDSINTVVDLSDKLKYRAIQYFYTARLSDNSGFETGQVYLIHDGNHATIYWLTGNSIGSPVGVSFNSQLNGSNLELLVTSDNSTIASRIIHLFKIALD